MTMHGRDPGPAAHKQHRPWRPGLCTDEIFTVGAGAAVVVSVVSILVAEHVDALPAVIVVAAVLTLGWAAMFEVPVWQDRHHEQARTRNEENTELRRSIS